VADGGGNGIKTLAGVTVKERQAGLGVALGVSRRDGLRDGAAVDVLKDLAGAGNGISLGVDQALDFKSKLDVATAIEALAGSALVGF
jgi:hypothetical protein